MVAFFLVGLATVMAIFGVLGYQRGGRSSLLTLGVTSLGMVLLGSQSATVIKTINGIWFGVKFALAGGLSAMGGTGDKADAIRKVTASMGPVAPLVPANQPGMAVLAILAVLIVIALLLGLIRSLRQRPSVTGLFLGLLNGYLITAYALASLAPALALLPSPFLPAGMTPATPLLAPSAVVGAGTLEQLLKSASGAAKSASFPLVLAVAFGLLVLIGTRGGNRGGKKG